MAGGHLAGAGVATPIDVAAAMAGSGLQLEIPDTRDAADLLALLQARAGGLA